jgi:hypothetical protein
MSSVFRTKNLQDTGIDNVFFFITEWISLKLKNLTDIKIRFKKNQTFSESAR